MDLNLLYEQMKIKAANGSTTNPNLITKDSMHVDLLNPNFDVSFAVNWKSPTWKNRYSCEFSAGYDLLFYAHQDGLKTIRIVLYGADVADLMFQGLTLTGRFNW